MLALEVVWMASLLRWSTMAVMTSSSSSDLFCQHIEAAYTPQPHVLAGLKVQSSPGCSGCIII